MRYQESTLDKIIAGGCVSILGAAYLSGAASIIDLTKCYAQAVDQDGFGDPVKIEACHDRYSRFRNIILEFSKGPA